MFNKVEVFGEVPLARFGHTITQGNTNLLFTSNYQSERFANFNW